MHSLRSTLLVLGGCPQLATLLTEFPGRWEGEKAVFPVGNRRGSPKWLPNWPDAKRMATPRFDLLSANATPAASAEGRVNSRGRLGSIRRAACLGWYLAIAIAAIADTVNTGLPAAGLAALFLGCSVLVLLWPGGFTLERAMIRSLLMGFIGLLAGVLACLAAPSGTLTQAEFLTFGAMSMLFGVLAAFPLALATALR